MKPIFATACVLMAFTAMAQDNADVVTEFAQPVDKELLKLDLGVRTDYQRDWQDGHNVKDNSGFMIQNVNLRLDGSIVEGLTYHWRQRFSKQIINGRFFDATDWLYLNYDIKRWSFSAGKEVVGIGGYEYDRAPIDLYSCSVFWNNIPCYELGVTVGYKVTPDDKLSFQVTQSPFYTSTNRDMYSYNLMWTSTHGFYQSLWSANMVEYSDGRFINYLALGNKFTFGEFGAEIDLMNRAASHQTFFFKDCSVMAEFSYRPTRRWNIFAKMTYDVNHSGTAADYTVADGTELTMVGAGVEYFPLLKDRTDLRLHANLFYSWGRNANSDNIMQNKTMILNVGVKWNMNLVNLKKRKK